MKWFVLLVGVVVVCFVVALVLGLVGGGMGRATSSLSHEPLPDDELRDPDLDELRFDVGLRGYRMSQVDGVVDRLRRELREKDEQIAVLRGDPRPLTPGDVAPAPAGTESHPGRSAETTQTDAEGPVELVVEQLVVEQPSEALPSDGQPREALPSDGQTEQRHRSEPSA
ncbi:DivIVA domain-containing protein [Humibacillus sp. DSM 29435]|uniref:DivIVA domain-containing protein n=1 Tax=Humibacillus sp. DSM 29435 TaxID=1869167 RepID=UPI000AD74B94|nr:DivIVA domain-containing protein [Humibacillus sp. DSM 29435]